METWIEEKGEKLRRSQRGISRKNSVQEEEEKGKAMGGYWELKEEEK